MLNMLVNELVGKITKSMILISKFNKASPHSWESAWRFYLLFWRADYEICIWAVYLSVEKQKENWCVGSVEASRVVLWGKGVLA